MPAKKPVKTTVRRTVKKYLTVKNAVIGAIVIGVVIILTNGWSIYEVKQTQKGLQRQQKELERISNEGKRLIELDRIRDSAVYERLLTNNVERQKAVSNIQKHKDERIKEIFSPSFTDDSIRSEFSKY